MPRDPRNCHPTVFVLVFQLLQYLLGCPDEVLPPLRSLSHYCLDRSLGVQQYRVRVRRLMGR